MSSEFLDQPLSFARSKSRQELELIVSVLMVDKQVNVDSGCVDSFHIYLLECINKPGLINTLLKWVQ